MAYKVLFVISDVLEVGYDVVETLEQFDFKVKFEKDGMSKFIVMDEVDVIVGKETVTKEQMKEKFKKESNEHYEGSIEIYEEVEELMKKV